MSTQLSDNSKLIAKFNIVDIYERNRISWWKRYLFCILVHLYVHTLRRRISRK